MILKTTKVMSNLVSFSIIDMNSKSNLLTKIIVKMCSLYIFKINYNLMRY